MKKENYPKWTLWLLRKICPDNLYESIAGDLVERFASDQREKGPRRARLYFILGCLKFVRPGLILRNSFGVGLGYFDTFVPNMKLFYRKFKRNKVYGFINVFGLAISLALVVLMFLFIKHEYSYDRFHEKHDQTYMLANTVTFGFQKGNERTLLPYALGTALMEEAPDIQYTSRYLRRSSLFLKEGQEVLEGVTYVDRYFLSMFSFEVIEGDRENGLNDPTQIIISEDIATKYFGEEDPIGKTMAGMEQDFIVSAVIANAPSNSSLSTGVLLNIEGIIEEGDNWDIYNVLVFVQTIKNSKVISRKITEIAEGHSGPLKEKIKGYFPDFDGGPIWDFRCIALKDVHFNESNALIKRSDPDYLYIMTGLAVLILLIACINYVLLTLSGSESSIKEIGIKKVIGVGKNSIRRQLLFESIVLAGISGVLAVFFAWLLLPEFNLFVSQQLEMDFAQDVLMVVGVLLIIVVTGVLAGAYPSFMLSALSPVKVLKQKATQRGRGIFTNTLIVTQFTICIIFIACAWTFHEQMKYIRNKDLGIDTDHVVKIHVPMKELIKETDVTSRLRNEIGNLYEISTIYGFPWYNQSPINIEDRSVRCNWFYVDYNWANVLGIGLLQGRNFDPQLTSDASTAVIVNAALARELNYEDPIGKPFPLVAGKDSLYIVGVMPDFNYEKLQNTVSPTFVRLEANQSFEGIFIKVPTGGNEKFASDLESAWKKIGMDAPLDFVYLDEMYAEMYGTEYRWQRIMDFATLFGVVIACLGLFGLMGIETKHRQKELAIRKVFGAGSMTLFRLINNRIVIISIISVFLSAPFVLYAMEEWLSGFAYRIDMAWYIVPVSGLIGTIVAGLAVLYPVVRVLKINPSNTLRSE